MDEEDSLLDLVYEAGAIPELWPKALQIISEQSHALGGLLFASNMRSADWIASNGIAPIVQQYLSEGWAERNPRPRRLSALKHAGFIQDLDVFTEEELSNEPVYKDFYRRHGIGWGAGTMFQMPSGDNIVFSFECAHELGPVSRDTISRLDRLRPHLARASLLTWRLGMRAAHAAAQALQALGLPAAVLSGTGRLQAANTLFEDLMPSRVQDRRERIALLNTSADALLGAAIGRLASLRDGAGVQSIPLPSAIDRPPLVLHLLPVKRQARDIFSQGSMLLVAMPVDKGRVLNADILEALFDLTPAEAAVARAIAEGRELRALAVERGVSLETVRAQLKAALSKTGTKRQAQLAGLLVGAMPIDPARA